MPDTQIEILGLDTLIDVIGQLQAMTVARDAMEEAVERVRTQIAVYPPPPHGYRMVWKSEKQRRWFFAALREGQIVVPYRRTGRLGQRWTTEVIVAPAEVRGVVGNVTTYGPWVQSEAKQAFIHQGRWRTAERLAREMEPTVQSLFDARFQAAMP